VILGAGTRLLEGGVRGLRHDCLRSTDNIGRRARLLAPQRRQDGLLHQPVISSARGRDAGERFDARSRQGRLNVQVPYHCQLTSVPL
jgi:hypothetical protein